jgi:hypothetical protein
VYDPLFGDSFSDAQEFFFSTFFSTLLRPLSSSLCLSPQTPSQAQADSGGAYLSTGVHCVTACGAYLSTGAAEWQRVVRP